MKFLKLISAALVFLIVFGGCNKAQEDELPPGFDNNSGKSRLRKKRRISCAFPMTMMKGFRRTPQKAVQTALSAGLFTVP